MTNQYSYAEDFFASENNSANVKKSAQKQADPNISSAAKVYMLSRMNKENAARDYRNGEFRGNKYMTSEDFVTYFHSRGKVSYAEGTRKKITEENAGEILRSSQSRQNGTSKATPNVSGAVRLGGESRKGSFADDDVKVYSKQSKKKAEPNVEGRTAVFNRSDDKKMSSKLKAVANEWMPEEKIVNVKVKHSPRRMAKMAAAVAGIAVSLMMIVGGSVLVSDANRETKELENELKALEIQRNELDLELDMKNDINLLRDKAVNELGMIRKEYVDAQYLDVSGSDSIQAHENEEDKDVGIAAILSAFGIG